MLEPRVILIGGTSHTGKSTLAEALAARLGGAHRSTDYIARHPGRPWSTADRQVPPHVAEHYGSLSIEALLVDVLRHYRSNIWPAVARIVATQLDDGATETLVLEGSALLPELVVTLPSDKTAALWLTASRGFLQRRIYAESRYPARTAPERYLIDQFVRRTWRFDQWIMETVEHLGLPSLDVETADTLPDLVDRARSLLIEPKGGVPGR